MREHKSQLNFGIFQHLETILDDLYRPIYFCNSYLFLTKLSASNIHKYHACLDPKFFKLSIYLFTYIFRLCARIILIYWRNFFMTNHPLPNDNLHRNKERLDHLFISHIVKNLPDKVNDNYFGQIPVVLKQMQKKIDLYYIQHDVKTANNRGFNLINSKINFVQLCNVIFQQMKNSLAIVVHFYRCKFKYFFLHLYVIEHQFSKITLHNIIISLKITKLCKDLEVRNLHLTFEGNGFEIQTTENLLLSTTKIYLHQFAPITSGHIGLTKFLERIKGEKVIIFTTGHAVSNYFKSIADKSIKIVTIGTSKSEISYKDRILTKKNDVLFLPEGTFIQSLYFTFLAKNLSIKFPAINFRIRLHPDLISNEKIKKIVKNLNLENLVVSDQSLYEDFRVSKVSIFHTSATGLQGMYQGVFPIHISEFDAHPDIMNPFFLLKNNFFEASNYHSLNSNFASIYYSKDHILNDELIKMVYQIFQPLDYQVLESF